MIPKTASSGNERLPQRDRYKKQKSNTTPVSRKVSPPTPTTASSSNLKPVLNTTGLVNLINSLVSHADDEQPSEKGDDEESNTSCFS